jgi:serine/threonine protein kinase
VSLPSAAPGERFGCPQCLSVFRAGFARCPLDGAALQALTGDPLIGHLLADRYVIEELLGEGGMGRVYRARHMRMSRRFAVKVLFGDMAADAKARTRFSREAEAVSRLNHPNVLSVVDFGETDEGLLYLVMDYIEGRELHQLLAHEAPLPTQRALEFLRQLARGLAHAHERDLVHRDFKTENVVVTRSGDEELARIVDFGIAAVGEMMEPNQRLTTEGMVLGTPAYMSPEQSTGEEVDERSDLFSLGVMLYEMLCGRLPFDGTAVTIARAHLAAEVPAIATRVPGLRPDARLEAVAMRLMAKDPSDRFQSARALLAHLDGAFGRADSQSDADESDATLLVESSEPIRSISVEDVALAPMELGHSTGARPHERKIDARWLATSVVVAITVVTVVVAFLLRRGDQRDRRAAARDLTAANIAESIAPPEAAAEPSPIPAPPPVEASPPATPSPVPSETPSQPPIEPVGQPVETPAKPPTAESPDESDRPRPRRRPADKKPAERAEKSDAKEDAKPAERAEKSDAKPADPKPADPKPADPKPADPKPADPKPADPKPADPKPVDPAAQVPPTPAAPPVVSAKEFLGRYETVGRQLDLLAKKRGDAAVSNLRRRYLDIPLQDALRSEAVRRDADRTLRSIASRVTSANKR